MNCDKCKVEINEGYYLNHPVIQKTNRGNEVVLGKTVCCEKCYLSITNKFINSNKVMEAEMCYVPIVPKEENENYVVKENEDDGFAEIPTINEEIKEATVIPLTSENTRINDVTEEY
jgi:hypothetical protein